MRVTSAASEDRGQGREACRGAVNFALDLDRDVVGDFRRMGGLQRRRLRTDGRVGGDGDREDARLGDDGGVTGGAGPQLAGEHIACVQGKNGYRFDVSARALSNASAAVKQNIVCVVRQHCRDAAAAVPSAVMSVWWRWKRYNVKRSTWCR